MINVHLVEEITGLSYANANTLIADLNAFGMLRETTGQKRNRHYAYAPYLSLLTNESFI